MRLSVVGGQLSMRYRPDEGAQTTDNGQPTTQVIIRRRVQSDLVLHSRGVCSGRGVGETGGGGAAEARGGLLLCPGLRLSLPAADAGLRQPAGRLSQDPFAVGVRDR